MSLETVKNFVFTSATKVYDGISTGVKWSGRSVKSGWNNYLVPTVTRAWNFVSPLIVTAFNFMKTGYGFAGLGFGAVLGMEVAAEKYFGGHNNRYIRYGIHFIAALTLIGSTLAAAKFGWKPVV